MLFPMVFTKKHEVAQLMSSAVYIIYIYKGPKVPYLHWSPFSNQSRDMAFGLASSCIKYINVLDIIYLKEKLKLY